MVICVDFDGTLVDHRYPDIGTENPGAFDWLRRWQAAGAKIVLWTMRHDSDSEGPVLTQAVEFCRARGVEFWGVNRNPDQTWSGSNKQYAHLYVDDSAVGCPLRPTGRMGGKPWVDWSVVGPAVLNRINNRGFPCGR